MAAVKEAMVVMEEEEKKKKKLQLGIAEFYDESSGIWENIWGDHMHHGFYDPDSTVSVSDHRAAQIRMIENSLTFASLSTGILSFSLLFSLLTLY
jgi:tocopherol O-methyltransferase